MTKTNSVWKLNTIKYHDNTRSWTEYICKISVLALLFFTDISYIFPLAENIEQNCKVILCRTW